jgi:hypothetical protein
VVAEVEAVVRGDNDVETLLERQAALATLCDLIRSFNDPGHDPQSVRIRFVEYYRQFHALASESILERNPYFLSPEFRMHVIAVLVSIDAASAYQATASYQRLRAATSPSAVRPAVYEPVADTARARD